MLISPIEKLIIPTEDVALLTKIFIGKTANLVNFIWFSNYSLNVVAADLNLSKNVFKIDMPPSFYYGGLVQSDPEYVLKLT